MPLAEKLYLAMVVVAFLIFAATLAWGDAQCRSKPSKGKRQS